jgi:uncharacterized protein (UPF0210 family)
MKIRSITTFCNPGWPLDQGILQKAGEFIAAARTALEEAGYEVQTTRLATPPFPKLLPSLATQTVIAFARELETAANAQGFDYISIGPALPEQPESYARIPEVLAATGNVFASGVMGDSTKGLSLGAVRACAEVIQRIAPLDPNGFGNLFFAALANVPPGAPFFPAAYHGDGPPAFSLATEAAGLAVEAFTSAACPTEARENIIAAIEKHARVIEPVSEALAEQSGFQFSGIDFSLAPFPETELSLGTAMERLGIPALGYHGSLAAAALLTEALERAQFKRTGFSGLILPVLEDATLAARAAQGTLTIKDLLLYSAVCGTGLDTVPLPGDSTVEQIGPILLDLATLALRLDKPLTARLMPIPGKSAGDATDFDFPYFTNSRVLALEAEPLQNALTSDETIIINPLS